ncbi:MAG TPA: hypothetical protein VKV24_20040 [Casimicrobiaceae bacterium]|nr:hypothetical protein [Casimicrobiaceae bacterium]
MPNFRLLPTPAARTITVRERIYTPSPGVPIDVDPADADALIGNGWIAVGRGGGRGSAEPAQVGPTSARPTAQLGFGTPLAAATQYVDTDVGSIVEWDGAVWRDPVTGDSV